MKTIWVINQFAGNADSGWGERHFFFSKYWNAAGYKVYIISGSFNHVFTQFPSAPNKYNFEKTENAEFCWIKTPKYDPKTVMRFWSFIVFAWRVIFLPTNKMDKPDVILVSSMPIFPILSGYFLKRKLKAQKLILEIRDLWPLTLNYLGKVSKRHPASLFIGWFEKFGYKKADYIVSLLPNARNHIQKIAGVGTKFRYIPNGLDATVLKNEDLDNKILDLIPQNKFIIGYTGALNLANAMDYFIEAAALLKNDERFFFVIIGEGYLMNDLKKKSINLNNILFIPRIKKNQVQSVLQRFSVCYFGRNGTPLYDYGVSANKYFDYMLAGKPVLDSSNYVKDPVELSGCGIIVKPDSARAIADGVIALYNMSESERNELGEKGKQFVSKFHSIKYLAELYIDIF